MPYLEAGREVTRSTICQDRWTVTVLVVCADRIPPAARVPALFGVQWRSEQEDTDERPEDTGPVLIRLRKRSPAAAGEIRFVVDGSPASELQFGRVSERRFVELEGASASTGGDDVELVVLIDAQEREILPLRCAAPAYTLAVTLSGDGESEEDVPLPEFLPPQTAVRLTAVEAGGAGGAWRWFAPEPTRLQITAGAREDTVTVVPHEIADPRTPRARLMVLLTVDGDGAVVGDAAFEIVDLERRFADRLLHVRHLQSSDYRARLEALAPADVEAFIRNAGTAGATASMNAYLSALLEFVRAQAPLREAPAEGRRNITIITGPPRWERPDGTVRTDPFYRYAEAYHRAQGGSTVVTAADLGVRLVSDHTPHASLQEILDYLRDNPPPDGGRWGRIDIVSHGDELGGMLAFVRPPGEGDDPDDHRVNATTLEEALAAGDIAPLPDDRIDVRTEVQIRGCAIGRSPEVPALLSRLFGGDDAQQPMVFAPRHLQVYEGPEDWRSGDAAPPRARTDSFYAEFFLLSMPSDEAPQNARTLAPDFAARFPDEAVDWDAALRHAGSPAGDSAAHARRNRQFSYGTTFIPLPDTPAARQAVVRRWVSGAGQAENVVETDRRPADHGTFDVDFRWTQPGPGGEAQTVTATIEGVGRPDLGSEERMLAWLNDQSVVVSSLARQEFAPEDFHWDDRERSAPEGERVLEVSGSRVIYRVERELREPDPAHADSTRRQRPSHDDPDHFGFHVPVRPPARPPGENVPWEGD